MSKNNANTGRKLVILEILWLVLNNTTVVLQNRTGYLNFIYYRGLIDNLINTILIMQDGLGGVQREPILDLFL